MTHDAAVIVAWLGLIAVLMARSAWREWRRWHD
jgi:hypothetical protein